MHASTEQLLSLRDARGGGGADGFAGQHVQACADCREQLASLRLRREALRALPALLPQSDPWQAIEARATAAAVPAERSRSPALWWSMGLAASVFLAALLSMLWPAVQPDGPAQLALEQPATRPATRDLVAESQRLEQLLRAVSHQPRVVNAGTADTIAQLEDRIALLDYGLSVSGGVQLTPADANALWRQRIDLMNSLVQVRVAQARRVDF